MTRLAHQDLILARTKKDVNPNTKQAAEARQQTINEQIDAFFKAGGEITKLPSYDETEPRPTVKREFGRNYENS